MSQSDRCWKNYSRNARNIMLLNEGGCRCITQWHLLTWHAVLYRGILAAVLLDIHWFEASMLMYIKCASVKAIMHVNVEMEASTGGCAMHLEEGCLHASDLSFCCCTIVLASKPAAKCVNLYVHKVSTGYADESTASGISLVRTLQFVCHHHLIDHSVP